MMNRLAHTSPLLRTRAYQPLPQNDEDSPPVQLATPRNGPTMRFRYNRFRHQLLHGEFTIVPDESRWLGVWDAIVMVAFAYTGIALPFEVAFLQKMPPVLTLTDYLGYWVFVVDMLVTCMVAFEVPRALTTHHEREPIKIIKHYMDVPFGWFWVDLFTLLPWQSVLGLNSMSVFRLLRLIRMLRLMRIVKLAGRWHSRIGLTYALVNIWKCIIATLFVLHWLSCVWGFFAVNGQQQERDTWYSNYVLGKEGGTRIYTAHEIYCTAVYFCAATLTGVGYGDIAPTNIGEIVWATCTIFGTGFMWAGVVGIIVNVVTDWDPDANSFQKLSDDLNLLLEARALPTNLRTRARNHLQESFAVYRQRFQRETLKALSPGLQVEIAIASGALEVIEKVSFLRGIDQDVIADLVSFLVPELYSPCEFVDKKSVSVIRFGACWWKCKVVTRDFVIGEDMILTSTILRDTQHPKTMTYVELLSLSRKDLCILCTMFPHFNRKIRFAQARMAVRRGIVEYSRRVRRARNGQAKLDPSKLTVKALEKDSQIVMFHEDTNAKILSTGEAVLETVTEIHEWTKQESEKRPQSRPYCSHEQNEERQEPSTARQQQESAKQSQSQPSCSHEQKEERQEISTARQQQAKCCCKEVLEAIDRLACLQEQLRDRIDEALAERRVPLGMPTTNPPRRMTQPSGSEAPTEATSNANDECTQDASNNNDGFTQAFASSSTVRWPGSNLPDGESGGSCGTCQQLSSLAMEARLDALSSELTRSVSSGPPAAASMLGGGQTSEGQLAWLALFQRQTAKIDGLRDSLDVLLGEVKEALSHSRGGAYFGTSFYGAAQQGEDGSIARHCHLSQQLHQQNQEHQRQLPQQMHPTQEGQVAGDSNRFISNYRLGLLSRTQPTADTQEDETASCSQPGTVDKMNTSPF